MKIYIASPYSKKPRALLMRSRIIDAKLGEVTSWWLDIEAAADPLDRKQMAEILKTDYEDIDRADVLVALTDSSCGRMTYAEIERALSSEKPVVWSTEKGGECVLLGHANVIPVETDEEVVRALKLIPLARFHLRSMENE